MARLQRHRGEALVSSPAGCSGSQAEWELSNHEGTSHMLDSRLPEKVHRIRQSVRHLDAGEHEARRVQLNGNRKKRTATASACALQIAGLHLASSSAIHSCRQRVAEGGCPTTIKPIFSCGLQTDLFQVDLDSGRVESSRLSAMSGTQRCLALPLHFRTRHLQFGCRDHRGVFPCPHCPGLGNTEPALFSVG